MGIFDIFKRDEEYKGFKLARDVDPALQKQLIDRGRGAEVNSLTPDFVSKANSSNQTANTTPMMISGGQNSLTPKLYDRFDPKKEVGMAKATLQEFGRLGEVDNFNKEIVAPVVDKVLSNPKVQQGLENTVGWANKVDDTLMGNVKRDDGSMALVSDLPIAQQAVGYAAHGLNRVGLGVLGSYEQFANFLSWQGVDAAKPLADKLADWQKAAGTPDGGFLDQLMSGVGSAASFFVPGIGMSSLAGIVGTYSPRVLQLLGGSKALANVGMTFFEAAVEAGDSYDQALSAGKSEKEAGMAGTNTFWANAILIGITNKFGFLAEGKGLKKVLASMGMESTQEFGQQVIQNLSQDKTGTAVFDGALEAAAIGGILGGVFGMSDLGSMGTLPIEGKGGRDRKEVAIPETFTRVENGKETKYFETSSEAQNYISSNNISDTAVVTQLGKEDAVRIISENNFSAFPFEGGRSKDQRDIDKKILEIQFQLGVGTSKQEATEVFNFISKLMAQEKAQNDSADDIFKQAVDQAKIENGIAPDIINEAVKLAEASVGIKAADEMAMQEKQAAQLADQYVTTEEAMASSKDFPFIQKLNIPLVAKKQILTASGKQALGKYSKGMIEFVENPKASTVPHEAVHAYMDIMMSKSQKQAILNEAKRRFAGKIASAKKSGSYKSVNVKGLTDDAIAEEILAEDMINYVKTGQASSNKLKRFYDWFVEQVKNLLGKGNIDIIDKFYKDVQSNPGVMQREAARKRLEKANRDLSELKQEFLQDPEALTSRALEQVDIKNREFSSYAYLTQVMKSMDKKIKKVEWDLVNDVLQTPEFKDNKKINMDDFRAAIRSELMPIEIIESSTYADYGVDENDRTISQSFSADMDRAVTYILNTPFNHGYQGHFTGDFEGRDYIKTKDDVKIMVVTKEQAAAQGQDVNSDKYFVVAKDFQPDASMTEDEIAPYYLAVKNSQELAEKWIEENVGTERLSVKKDTAKGLLAHVRVAYMNDGSAKILEVQSDTMQKKSQEDLTISKEKLISDKQDEINKKIPELQDKEKAIKAVEKAAKMASIKDFNTKVENDSQFGIDFRNAFENAARETHGMYMGDMLYNESAVKPQAEILDRLKLFSDFNNKSINSLKSSISELKEDIKRLHSGQLSDKEKSQIKHSELFKSYYSNWYEMAVKQAIRQVALEGATSVSFPTAYTANKIENWDGQSGDSSTHGLSSDDIYAGNTVEIYGEQYTITKVYGDGSFTAVDQEPDSDFTEDDIRPDIEQRMRDDMEYYNERITEDIVNNWPAVYGNKIERVNYYIKNAKERLATSEKRLEEHRQKQTDFANGQYKDTLENVIEFTGVRLFNRYAVGGQYFYATEENGTSKEKLNAILSHLDKIGVKYEKTKQLDRDSENYSDIIAIAPEYFYTVETSNPDSNIINDVRVPKDTYLVIHNDFQTRQMVEGRLNGNIRSDEDSITYTKDQLDGYKKIKKQLDEINKVYNEEHDDGDFTDLVDVDENSELFEDEINEYIEKEAADVNIMDELSGAYDSVYEYEDDRGDTRYLVFSNKVTESNFDPPSNDSSSDIIENRQEFEKDTNYIFPDVEIWAKNKNGEERNKGMLLQLDGKSDRDVEAMTPEEKTAYRAEYTAKIKKAIEEQQAEQMTEYENLKKSRTESRGRIDNIVEPVVYPVRMVFPGLDADYQAAAMRYQGAIPEYLQKLRGKDKVEETTDDYGFTWFTSEITPEDKAAVEAFQVAENQTAPLKKTGRQVADYVEQVQQGKLEDAEEYGDSVDTEPLSSYMRGVISDQSYTLGVVKIKDLLKQDEDLREYVKNGDQRYPDGVSNPDNLDLPIVVGTWGDKSGIVLDGYNRTLTKYQNGDEVIEAWISNDGQGLPQEDREIMVNFIDYARGDTAEDIKLEIDARYVAEGLSINPNVSNKVLANRFEAQLNNEPKFQEPADIFREGEKNFVRETELVARERFNIPLLEKLSFGGSDRDVYNLGDKVLKVAKSARGLAQNRLEGEPYAPVPEVIERGDNYVVTVMADKPNKKTKDLVKALNRNKNFNSRTPAVDMINDTANEYYNAGDDDMGGLIQDLNNYNVMLNDITAIRNWGTIDGEPVLIDAGSLDTNIIKDYEGKTNLNDSDFRDIYRRSRAAKQKYGDQDEKTKYQEPSELDSRLENLQRTIAEAEINDEMTIQDARERSLEYSDYEKENGYQNFVKMASRRPWILDNQTDERMIKDRLPALNIDNTLFSAATGQTNNELLEEFKDRYYQEQELKTIAKQKTPTEIAAANSRMAERIVSNATVGVKLPSIKDGMLTDKNVASLNRAINVANGIEKPITITKKASVLLKNRLRDMVKASKAGYAIGRAEMRADLNLAFAGQLQYEKMIKQAIIAYSQDLPVADRGAMLTAVANAKNMADMAKAFARIDAALQANDNKLQIAQMAKMAAKVKKAMKTGNGIAVDYQKKIADILNDYNLKKPTAATIAKLNGLSDYIAANPDANIPAHLVKRLDTLKKMSPKDIENDSLRDLNDLLLRLWHLGELKKAMKGKYNERFIKNSVDKLLTTTVNIDKKSIGGLSWLHAPRVADILDGIRQYKGYNVALQKKVSHAVAKAMQRSEQIIKEALDYISAIKNEFTKEEQAIMAFNMAKDQGLFTQAQALIGAYAGEYGWKSEADLVMTPEMTHAVNVLRGTFAKTVDYLAAVYEEIENKPFIKGENYFPNKYDKNFDKNVDLDAPTIGEMQNYQGKQINKGFTFARQKGVKKVLRTDIFNVFAEAISEQQYYMGVQPVLNEIASIVSQPAYQERVGKVGVQWWDRYLKGVANKGRSLNRGIFDAWLREKRLNISKAVLGYKVTSAMIQPTAIIDAYAYIYLNHGALAANELIIQLAANFAIPGYTKRTVAKSLGLQFRKGDAGEQILQELASDKTGTKFGRAFVKGGMWALRGLDLKTAAATQKTMYNYFRRNGMDVAEAQREADFVMNLTQGSSEIGDVPLVLMEGEAYRTLLTFQTFVLNRWGIITHDIIRSGIVRGNLPRKLKGLIALFLMSLAGGIENYLRTLSTETVSGKKYPQKFNFMQQALLTIPESTPVIGSILTSAIEYGQGASIPLSRLSENIIKGATAFVNPTGETKKEQELSRTKGALKLGEALATYWGITGSAQAADLITRALVPPTSTKSAGGSNNNLQTPALPKLPELPKPPKLPKPPMR